ncbi:MAG: hypothetical protein QOH26_2176 [Actinomycetota bacterium]|nr:hypothetical protein [Actinomycetota bacterium]
MLPMPVPERSAADRAAIPVAPILVVDDDAKIVRRVRTSLERDGFSVVTAADGPAVTIVVAVAFLGERLKPIQWVGLAGVLLGMIAIGLP